jgi:hypothetical protein
MKLLGVDVGGTFGNVDCARLNTDLAAMRARFL